MEFKTYSQRFQEAIEAKEFVKAEAILVSTECKKDLIKEYIQINSKDTINKSLACFKSKGLIKMIEEYIV